MYFCTDVSIFVYYFYGSSKKTTYIIYTNIRITCHNVEIKNASKKPCPISLLICTILNIKAWRYIHFCPVNIKSEVSSH